MLLATAGTYIIAGRGILPQYGSGAIPADCNAWRLTNKLYNDQNSLPMYYLVITLVNNHTGMCFNTHSPVFHTSLPIHCQIHNKIACARLFREIAQDEKEGLHWQVGAIAALQEGFEDYLVGLFRDCVLEAIRGQRVTVMPKDIFITRRIRGETNKYKVPGTISLRDIKDLDKKGSGSGKRKPKKGKKKRRDEEYDRDGNPIY